MSSLLNDTGTYVGFYVLALLHFSTVCTGQIFFLSRLTEEAALDDFSSFIKYGNDK